MRICLLGLLLTLCVGCNRPTNEDIRKQVELDLHNYYDDVAKPVFRPSHVITAETEYYTTGPQQGRPPDGKFAAGTKVTVVEEAGSYVLVESEDWVKAYVAADVPA